ncbi:hypothetical protein BCV70DRAFT_17223 [Testicularia cyperi]|uniref:MIP18 family-like domain-containing protein n=1 Tax=Testicularia cyperi TaxID=1882483 RepID=A0A317XYQ8_9BASI|nr:hypothetical protein BCV70DRAFT_17223 [Testicularia cyperi]
MAEKDNANPIVYQSGSTLTHRSSSAAQAEWWRDPSIHSSSNASGSSSHAGGAAGASSTSAFAFATRLPLADLDDDDDAEYDEQDGDLPTSSGSRDDGDSMDQDSDTPRTPIDSAQPTLPDGKAVKDLDDEKIDSQEVYDLIRSITDPEHPLTLEQLAVVNAAHITVDHGDVANNRLPHVLLEFTPTIPHCSMATLIGLSLRVRLLRSLPDRFKVDIRVRPGTHQSENAVNKQLNDKERVAAALENSHLFGVVQGCLSSAARRGKSEEDLRRDLESGTDSSDTQNIWKTVDEIASKMGLAV